jgi:hypothetical protein
VSPERLPLRATLVGLIVVATAAFAVGVTIESNSGDSHGSESAPSSEAAESPEQHAEEGEVTGEAEEGDGGEDETFLGIDLESTPFVILAAIASLALAVAAWYRPSVGLFGLIALAMLAFAILDVREVFHQSDEANGGLAVLAGAVALLHLGASGVSATERQRAAAR